MNSKIQKLAEQVGFYGEPKFENLETFAELIIKECLKEINDMIVDESEQLYPNNKQTTEYVNERLMDAHDNIVDLFGIE